MRLRFVVALWVFASACGGTASRAAHTRTDVVTATWTRGDDVPLTAGTAPR